MTRGAAARLLTLQFDRAVPNAWRVTNSNDAVTLVPRMLGYCHVSANGVCQLPCGARCPSACLYTARLGTRRFAL